jgi:twitching motility protein PilT
MPFVDRIIQYMQSQAGERIVLVNDQESLLYRAGGASEPVPQRLSLAQISSMLTEIMTEENRARYAAGDSFSFPYQHASGPVGIEVRQESGTVHVSLGPLEPPSGDGAAARPAVAPRPAPASFGGPRRRPGHIDELFRLMRELGASDLHMSANEVPMARVNGRLEKLQQYEVNDPKWLKSFLWQIVPERKREEWERSHDADFVHPARDGDRFRCSLFADRHGPGAVFRLIPSRIPTPEELDLPPNLLELCSLPRGLVLVTGSTSSGKSTTLAALLDQINRHRTAHVVTVEDPVEFVHENVNCLVNQREVNVHTTSYARALRAALRANPDVILVDELRDPETAQLAIETAAAGHLVLTTLRAPSVVAALDRLVHQFPESRQESIRFLLAETLEALIAQTLCRTVDGWRVPAWEILRMHPAPANLIREDKVHVLPAVIESSDRRLCLPPNESLFGLVRAGRVAPGEALARAADRAGLRQLFERAGIPAGPEAG